MSHTTTDNTRTLHAVPTPGSLAGLTGAPAAIYIKLVGLTEPATAAELALAAGTGRSTAGKALATLEQQGLAVRTPGGASRTPDRWRAAPTQETNSVDNASEHAPVNAQPEPSITDSSKSVTDSPDPVPASVTETAPDSSAADAAVTPVTQAVQDTPLHNTEHLEGEETGEDDSPREASNDNSPDQDTPPAQASAGRQTVPTYAITLAGGKKRLAPGALRQMVTDYLKAHPGEAFTATKISRVIEKSSGAIANALVTLVEQGIAEQAGVRPRTYRLTAPADNA
ncbi:helix-turn-helix domain-containing protein [Streptomyces sp. NPDC056672]|uniref:helix-turn-helix domain-containing protein n=1 Tax=Streptomyces sp. NPDC056672 TaxID=3345906 RepID=UPI0036C810E3